MIDPDPDFESHVDALRERGGPIPADEVEVLCTERGVSVDALMLRLLPTAAAFARVPISSYPVGAVAQGLMEDGRGVGALYLGANVEFTGQALAFSVHAEQAAVINAWQHGECGLTAIATSAAPCGHCRQFLYEVVAASRMRVLESPPVGSQVPRNTALSALLPHAFTAVDLGLAGGLMDPRFEEPLLSLQDPDTLVQAAVDAARQSYVPYTFGRAGCALETVSGGVFVGRYAESAAYNPSVSPLESAVAFMVMNSPAGASREITRAVLVESPSKASQRGATEAVLGSVAPGVRLEYREIGSA